MISVQENDFDTNAEYQELRKGNSVGAIVTFVGQVREFSSEHSSFLLQHYPGMTEKVLEKIEQEANERWPLIASRIIHRVGNLNVEDQIVFVGVSAQHRKDAFAACEYMIDILKTQAPFWKKEGDNWVEANSADDEAAKQWLID